MASFDSLCKENCHLNFTLFRHFLLLFDLQMNYKGLSGVQPSSKSQIGIPGSALGLIEDKRTVLVSVIT